MSHSPAPPHEDETLLRRFVAGDAAACRAVERWANQILYYRRLGLTAADREDIVQDVLTGVWQAAGRPGFALRHGLRAFVRTGTLARAFDRVRRRRSIEPLSDALRDPTSGPEARAELREDFERLCAALAVLDARCRDIIHLHYFEDWSYARIAGRAGRAEATMRVRMFNCLRALRQQLSTGASQAP